MINADEAVNLMQKMYPELTITEGCEFDGKYVFTAVRNPRETDFSDPYYAVDRSDGGIHRFSPSDRIEEFFEALVKHPVKIR